jgi:hypothetical protein
VSSNVTAGVVSKLCSAEEVFKVSGIVTAGVVSKLCSAEEAATCCHHRLMIKLLEKGSTRLTFSFTFFCKNPETSLIFTHENSDAPMKVCG